MDFPPPEYIGDNLVKITIKEFFVLFSNYQAYIAYKKRIAYRRQYEAKRKTKNTFELVRGNLHVDFQ
jgi:hypothetical protein